MNPPDNSLDLAGVRFHTGATPRPLGEGERCPPLFRDLGPLGMQLYLSGELRRLAGPMAPILYLRTARYVEPYEDADEIGRLAILVPSRLTPWHAGSGDVFVTRAHLAPDPAHMVVVPTAWSFGAEAERLDGLPDADAVREVIGWQVHREMCEDLLARTTCLIAAQEASEQRARPVRRMLQTGTPGQRERIRASMREKGVSERDLCSAWHHVPAARRQALDSWLANEGQHLTGQDHARPTLSWSMR
jgi:hypothetical protein